MVSVLDMQNTFKFSQCRLKVLLYGLSAVQLVLQLLRSQREMKTTLAVAAGVVDEVYKMDLIINLIDARASSPEKRGPY